MTGLGQAPPGLYHDEAFNGLDALGVLRGDWSIYFPANHGREPIYIYLVAVAVRLFGATPFAVRLPAAIVGTLTIPATYWMARQLWGRRVALTTAALMTVTLWPLHLSRIGFRAVLLPLAAALGIGLTVRAWRSGACRDWLAAGLMWGLAAYTYLAVRFVPLVFILFVVFLLIFRRIQAGPFLPERLSNGAVWATVGCGLVVAPLAIYTLGHWDAVMGRPGGVSILEPGINQGDFVGTLVRHTLNALGMFVWQGDRIPRHNLPYRPVFDPLLSAAFVVGLIVAIRQARRRIAAVFALTWLAVMLLPTILSEDAPHFLRAVGVLPVAMVFPALGLDWIAEKIGKHGGTEARRETTSNLGAFVSRLARPRRFASDRAWWLITGVLAVSALWTVGDYTAYATSVETGYAFEAGAVELAGEANRLSAGGRRVVMDDVFLQEWTAIPFMLSRTPDVVLSAGADLPDQPASPTVLIAWPYTDWPARLAAWRDPIQIQVQAGPLAQGDRDPQPYVMAVLARIEPRVAVSADAEADFEGGVRLLGHAIEDRGAAWRLRTLWQIDRPQPGDVTLFVHLLNGGTPAVSADGDAGDGLYPIGQWRIGDVIVDECDVSLPAGVDRAQLSMEIGLYDRRDGARIEITYAKGPVVGDALQLGAPGGPGP